MQLRVDRANKGQETTAMQDVFSFRLERPMGEGDWISKGALPYQWHDLGQQRGLQNEARALDCKFCGCENSGRSA